MDRRSPSVATSDATETSSCASPIANPDSSELTLLASDLAALTLTLVNLTAAAATSSLAADTRAASSSSDSEESPISASRDRAASAHPMTPSMSGAYLRTSDLSSACRWSNCSSSAASVGRPETNELSSSPMSPTTVNASSTRGNRVRRVSSLIAASVVRTAPNPSSTDDPVPASISEPAPVTTSSAVTAALRMVSRSLS